MGHVKDELVARDQRRADVTRILVAHGYVKYCEIHSDQALSTGQGTCPDEIASELDEDLEGLGDKADVVDAIAEVLEPGAELPTVRFHDLRHTAGTLATQNGATLKEVMSRLGHSTTAAAIRYQRAADERDREVANRLDDVFGARVLEVPSQPLLAAPARYPRDEIEPSQGFPEEESLETALFRAFREYPQRDSNPCRHLERVVSWATRRWGPGRRSRRAPPDLQMCLSSERRTRTPNNWTRTSCVANYTISEGWSRPVAECAPKSIESVARASSASEPVTASRTDR